MLGRNCGRFGPPLPRKLREHFEKNEAGVSKPMWFVSYHHKILTVKGVHEGVGHRSSQKPCYEDRRMQVASLLSRRLSSCGSLSKVPVTAAQAAGRLPDAKEAQPLWCWPPAAGDTMANFVKPRCSCYTHPRQCLPELGNQLRRASEAATVLGTSGLPRCSIAPVPLSRSDLL